MNIIRVLFRLIDLFVYDSGKIGGWRSEDIAHKIKTGEKLTFAERHALEFFGQMHDYMGALPEKWHKPYGSVLNEKRTLR